MRSRLILFIHTVVFGGITVTCIASPFIKAAYPAEFSQYFLWAACGVAVIILGSWHFYNGACPLTVWENQARRREGRATYSGSCIDRNAKRWFGWTPPKHFSNIFPVAVLLIPIVTGFFL